MLKLLSEGMGVPAVCRSTGVTADSIRSWTLRAAQHVNELSAYLQQDMHLTQCQIDEFWSFIYKKKGNLREEEVGKEDRGDRWCFVNVLPRSSFIHTVHHGKRNQEETDKFVEKVKSQSDGQAPLFLSDGWSSYEETLKKHYCTWELVPYSGRGRPKNPIQLVDSHLNYAQVVKTKKNGKLIELQTRVILGKEEDILKIIQSDNRGKTINTSYVESRNGNYRKDNKRLTRKTQCHSKKCDVHDAQIDFITAVYNFVDEAAAFRECINPSAKKFETKYRKVAPAMLEGITDRRLSLEELLMMRGRSS